MKRILVVILGALFLLPISGKAQLKTERPAISFQKLLTYGANPIGLVSGAFMNSEKINMRQSYSFMMSRFNGHTINQAMYLNTMRYQISEPLTLSLQWGYLLNQPFSKLNSFQPNIPMQNGFFLSNAKLEYKLGDHSKFQMEFNRYPGGYYSPFQYDTWPY